MSKLKEITISYEDDFSSFAMEGDDISKEELKRVLAEICSHYSDYIRDEHFFQSDGSVAYFTSYFL